MDQEIKERIEKELKNYPLLKSRIKIKTNKIAYQEDYSAKAVDYSKIPGGETNSIYSDVESFVQRKLDRYPDLLELILKKEKIEAALESLNYKEKRLVRYKYFEGMTDNEVSDKMRELEIKTFKWRNDSTCKEYSSTTIQRMKKKVLKKLQKVGL
jgi:DNA-directed RNA polymerase specialized sigma24 family protein